MVMQATAFFLFALGLSIRMYARHAHRPVRRLRPLYQRGKLFMFNIVEHPLPPNFRWKERLFTRIGALLMMLGATLFLILL